MASSVASGPGRSMLKLSARKKRLSGTQRLPSTSSRCMMAIWPAGPPKLMKPNLTQKRNASPKLTRRGVWSVTGAASAITGLLVYGRSRCPRQEHVQALSVGIERGGVSAAFGGHALGDRHATAVDNVDLAWVADGHVQ